MINEITLVKLNADGVFEPKTGQIVKAYLYDETDPNKRGTLLGTLTEGSNGKYYSDNTGASVKVTIVVGSENLEGFVGIMWDGETALADSVDTASIQDDAVTNDKLKEFSNF